MATNVRAAYRQWWLGKYCRAAGSQSEFKLVTGVLFIGSPSGVYGDVTLSFEDGTRLNVDCGDAFKPRKRDVEVKPE